jgi:hypothetical protein
MFLESGIYRHALASLFIFGERDGNSKIHLLEHGGILFFTQRLSFLAMERGSHEIRPYPVEFG